MANLRAAHHCLSPEQKLRYCVSLVGLWLRRIDLAEAHKRFTDALEGAPEPVPERAEALLAVSAIDYRAGTLSCGEAHVRESHAIAERLAATGLQWRTLQRFGDFAIARDVTAVAEKNFEQARRLARREGNAAEEAVSVYSLGIARRSAGDLDGAEQLIGASADSLRSLAGDGGSIPSPLNISETRPGETAVPSGLRTCSRRPCSRS